MRVSVSEIKLFMECPMKWYFRYHLHRGKYQIQQALEVGTLAHKAFEAILNKRDWRSEVEAFVAESRPLISQEWDRIETAFDTLSLSIAEWEVPDDWEVLHTERELEIACGRHTIVGRLDAIVRWNGSCWHLQHKSLDASKPVAVYCEQQRTDWHESVYQRMAEEAEFVPFAGTILNGVRKLTRSTIERVGASTALFCEHLPRTDDEVNSALADLAQVIDDMDGVVLGTRRAVHNRAMCAGPFRNSLCEYKAVCDGEVAIDGPDYHNLEVRYAIPNETNV